MLTLPPQTAAPGVDCLPAFEIILQQGYRLYNVHKPR